MASNLMIDELSNIRLTVWFFAVCDCKRHISQMWTDGWIKEESEVRSQSLNVSYEGILQQVHGYILAIVCSESDQYITVIRQYSSVL